jgi:hypothetical protein
MCARCGQFDLARRPVRLSIVVRSIAHASRGSPGWAMETQTDEVPGLRLQADRPASLLVSGSQCQCASPLAT